MYNPAYIDHLDFIVRVSDSIEFRSSDDAYAQFEIDKAANVATPFYVVMFKDYMELMCARSTSPLDVNEAAERARLRYITDGAGKAQVYLLKAAEAKAYKDAGYPIDMSQFPLLSARVQAMGLTPQAAADEILARRDQLLQLAAAIEAVSEKAIKDISEATNEADAYAIRDQAIATLNGI